MSRYSIVCEGELSVSSNGAPICAGEWSATPALIPFDISQVDPVVAVQYLSAGFGIVLTLWVTSRSIKAIYDVIRARFP